MASTWMFCYSGGPEEAPPANRGCQGGDDNGAREEDHKKQRHEIVKKLQRVHLQVSGVVEGRAEDLR
jgi:hypothetical protein